MTVRRSTKRLTLLLAVLCLGADANAKDEMWLCWMSGRQPELCLAYLIARIESPDKFTSAEQSQNWSKRAFLFLQRRDNVGALRDAERALELDSANGNALAARASSLLRLGRYDEAIADYSTLVELTKSGARGNFPLVLAIRAKADALRLAGRLEQAIEEYTSAIQELENSALNFVGANGISVLAETIVPVPTNPKENRGEIPPKVIPASKSPLAAELFTRRGDTYYALGDRERAREDYSRAEEITPTLRPLKSITVDPDRTRN